ncbi:hypothetical protein [Bradyrhizobium diazoefficiens]|nr:hypothetical protein [Bradyrhizobium diazoefficiens]
MQRKAGGRRLNSAKAEYYRRAMSEKRLEVAVISRESIGWMEQ